MNSEPKKENLPEDLTKTTDKKNNVELNEEELGKASGGYFEYQKYPFSE